MAKKKTNKDERQTVSDIFGASMTEEEFEIALGRSSMEEVAQMLRLKAQGYSVTIITRELGISKSTYHRRMKEMRNVTGMSAEEASQAVMSTIAEIIASFKKIRDGAYRQTGMLQELADPNYVNPVPLEERAKFSKIALSAHSDLVNFLLNIGFFEPFRTQQRIKADNDLSEYVNDELQVLNLKLLDQVHALRENIRALREGKEEPFPEAMNDMDTSDMEQWVSRKTDTSDTISENADFLLH